jgi:hypothetical protein
MTAIILLTLVCPACSRVISVYINPVCCVTSRTNIQSHITLWKYKLLPPFLWNTRNTKFLFLPGANVCCVIYQAWWKWTCQCDCLRLRNPCPLAYQAPDKCKSETNTPPPSPTTQHKKNHSEYKCTPGEKIDFFFFCTLISLFANTVSTFVGPCIVIYFHSTTNQMHNTSNLFYFGTTLYIFRTVSPSIIRSPRLYIQHHTIQVLWLLASKKPQNLYNI